jgi:hypothetical protein
MEWMMEVEDTLRDSIIWSHDLLCGTKVPR